MATLASDARRRLWSSATCCRSAATRRTSDVDASAGSGGKASLIRDRWLVGVSPAFDVPEPKGEARVIEGDAGSIELVEEWREADDSAGLGGTCGLGGASRAACGFDAVVSMLSQRTLRPHETRGPGRFW